MVVKPKLTNLLIKVLIVVDDLVEKGLDPLEKAGVVGLEVFIVGADAAAIGAVTAFCTAAVVSVYTATACFGIY